MAGLDKFPGAVRGATAELLHAYAQIVFSRSRLVGALLLAATLTAPQEGLFGVCGFLLGAAFAKGLGVYGEGIGKTPYGPNVLLVTLGVAHAFGTSGAALTLCLGAALAAVLVTAALSSLSTRIGGLPFFSVPFVLVLWGVTLLSRDHGVAEPLGPSIPPAAFDVAPFGAVLQGIGGLLFAPRAISGGLVALALLVHSRIACLLALVGTLAALPFAVGQLGSMVLLNGALAAMATGGVYFVPSLSSFGIGALASAVSAVITIVLASTLEAAGLSPLILPFAVSVTVVLLAMGQRGRDSSPKSVDFVPGSPEENLAYYRMRVARFRAPYAVAFQLPFRGVWTCTQGVDGEFTHKAEWRHAFDFEVAGDDGALFRGDGAELHDHYCFKLPVLASADGLVVKVVNDVADNSVGGLDLARNWGNVVVLQHGPGLYSLVAHLAKGSVRVYEGQSVRRGDLLGVCGNSGRSPRPHLHFQLQATAKLGAPTLPCRFTDTVFRRESGEEIDAAAVPNKGDRLRNVDGGEAASIRFAPEPGAILQLRTLSRDAQAEQLESDVDLLGHRILRSRETGAVLYFTSDDRGFTAYDVLGDKSSALHVIRAALGRMPFDQGAPAFSDYLPTRFGKHVLLRPFADFVAPFVPDAGLLMHYRVTREEGRVVISGESKRRRRGAPLVQTSAVVSLENGLEFAEVTSHGKRVSVVADTGEDAGGPHVRSATHSARVIRQVSKAGFRPQSTIQAAASLGETS